MNPTPHPHGDANAFAFAFAHEGEGDRLARLTTGCDEVEGDDERSQTRSRIDHLAATISLRLRNPRGGVVQPLVQL